MIDVYNNKLNFYSNIQILNKSLSILSKCSILIKDSERATKLIQLLIPLLKIDHISEGIYLHIYCKNFYYFKNLNLTF